MIGARIRRVVVSAGLAAVVFGSWAYGVNFHDPAHRFGSALAQAGFSFLFSLVVMSLTEATFALLAGRSFQVPVAIAVPVGVSATGAGLVHAAMHTAAIGMTLSAPLLIGTAYQAAYGLALKRREAGEAGPRAERDRAPVAPVTPP